MPIKQTSDPPDLTNGETCIEEINKGTTANAPSNQYHYNLCSKKLAQKITQPLHSNIITNISRHPIDKLNITTENNLNITFDHQTHPVLDYNPAKKLKKWQQDIINDISNNKYSVHNANAVYDPTSKFYLEYRELLKTSEAAT